MEYLLELQFSKLDADLRFSDRFSNRLDADIIRRGDLTCFSILITLPNRILIEMFNKSQTSEVELFAVWLGGIKFKDSALERLFVYSHSYGKSRSSKWNFGGQVEFEFFESSAIKYHLIMGSTI